MLFNSIQFAVFLTTVFMLYWFCFRNYLRYQNFFLLVVSYIFYGWWDWRFLSLILLSALIDYFLGIKIYEAKSLRLRRLLLSTSLTMNLGLLFFFKYFNFFIESWIDAWAMAGITMNVASVNVILPVGISFYTFQTLSYSIDVFRNRINPTRSFIDFATYVSFFPQLVAGPIERATNLLPQILSNRRFSYPQAVDGMRLILYGLFKKIVIADTLAIIVDETFSSHSTYSSLSLFIGVVAFAFQIYCDFSGYSDIAIGTAKLFGIELMSNFKFPYWSRDISEFWRRWHISLSAWFRDYLYVPLGGSRCSLLKTIRNVFLVFLISGFWHGANWNFVLWGGIHAGLFIPMLVAGKNRKYVDDVVAHAKSLPGVRESFQIISTFFLVSLAWIFFRAPSLEDAWEILFGIFSLRPGNFVRIPWDELLLLVIGFVYFLMKEWINRRDERSPFPGKNRIVRNCEYFLVGVLILASFKASDTFIYFQF